MGAVTRHGLKVIVQHVAGKREDLVRGIQAQFPHAIVVECDGRPLVTQERCLNEAGSTGAVMLEDDAILCNDFERIAFSYISRELYNVINFFSRRVIKGTGLVPMPGSAFIYCVGYWLPPNIGPRIANYLSVWPKKEKNPTGFDTVINDWLVENKRKCFIVNPSIVQHAVGKSVIGGRPSDRSSPSFKIQGVECTGKS